MNFFIILLLSTFPAIILAVLEGIPAHTESVSYLVSIRKKIDQIKDFQKGHICGGVLIHRKVVLTAATCLVAGPESSNLPPGTFRVIGGSTQLHKDKNLQHISEVQEILTHPNVNFFTGAHNIALIILVTQVSEFSATLVPIFLPEAFLELGSLCTIAGWGVIDEQKETKPENATIGFVHTVALEICQKHHVHMPRDSLCISANTTMGPCYGDTGGPLIYNGRLVGILQPPNMVCNITDKPALIVDVFVNMNWILDNIPLVDATSGGFRGESLPILCIFLIFFSILQ